MTRVARNPKRWPAGVVALTLIASLTGHAALARDLTAVERAAGVRETGDFDLGHARFESLSDGDPNVLIPTHMLAMGRRKIETHFDTLALVQDGKWYLVAIDSPARPERLRKAFPAFAGVDVGDKTETKP